METYTEIQDWVMAEVNDTSSNMRAKVERYIHTILTPQYLGVDYDWNLNVTTLSLASGASTIALPSLCSKINLVYNDTYDSTVLHRNYRQREMRGESDGVLKSYQRIGNNLVFPQLFGGQTVRLEWFPQFASLASGGAIPLCPEKQVIADGAKWLAFKALGKDKASADAEMLFLNGKAALKNEDVPLASFEDQSQYLQEG